MEPTRTTVKKLFARCRNRCAFPECSAPIVEDNDTVTGIICHIRARNPGGPRYSAKQTEEQRHDAENLILMCSRHSKVIDSEPRRYTVTMLEAFKAAHERPFENELSVAEGRQVDLLVNAYRDTYINATQVVIERLRAEKVIFPKTKPPIIAAPRGSIGSVSLKRNYAKHLIDQYNDFASKQPSRGQFSFAAIYGILKKRYGVGKWELIPLTRFDDLCGFLQQRIDRTFLGRVNRSKGYSNYSTLDEYQIKYFSP
jgi:hypothetical protein